MNRGLVLMLAGVMLLAGCGSAAAAPRVSMPEPTTTTLHGVLDVNVLPSDMTVDSSDLSCALDSSGFSDISPGATVAVTNTTGARVGTGALDAGIEIDTSTCEFAFAVSLPSPLSSSLYGVTVTHRGTVQFTQAQIKSDNITLTLGDGTY